MRNRLPLIARLQIQVGYLVIPIANPVPVLSLIHNQDTKTG